MESNHSEAINFLRERGYIKDKDDDFIIRYPNGGARGSLPELLAEFVSWLFRDSTEISFEQMRENAALDIVETNSPPTTLAQCIGYLCVLWAKEDIDAFGKMSEDKALAYTHHFSGREIRNAWGLWKPESPLYQHFAEMGLHHADDMSGVILTSFHRYLNGKDQDIEGQIKKYQDHWKSQGILPG